MKKQLFSLALVLGLAAPFATSSIAADLRPASGHERQGHDKDRRRGEQSAQDRQHRSDELAKELGLSSKQKSKVEKIFQDQQQQMQALRSNSGSTSMDRSQKMAQAKRIRESTDKKLKDVLSKKQYAQFEAKRQDRMRQMSRPGGDRPGQERRSSYNGRS
ncbi:hypothetical protein GCM10027346_09170 [Hymenobacter seoulensis]